MSMICNTFCVAFSFRNGDYYSHEFAVDNEVSICFSSEKPSEVDLSTINNIRAFIENKIQLSEDQNEPFSDWFGELGDSVAFDDLFESVGQSDFTDLDSLILLINDDAERTYHYVKVRILPYAVSEGEEHAVCVSSKGNNSPTPLEFTKRIADPPEKVVASESAPDTNANISKKIEETVAGISMELFKQNFTFHESNSNKPHPRNRNSQRRLEIFIIDSYIGDSTVVQVPAFVEGKAVEIESLGSCPNVREIVIPDTVTYKDYAFADCPGLYQHDGSLVINNRLVSICCDSPVLTIPNGIKVIGTSAIKKAADIIRAFKEFDFGIDSSRNTTIEEIVFPDGLLKIEAGAFADCVNLKKVSFPDSLETIGDSAFRGCKQLSDIDLPDKVTTIGDSAFEGCESLKIIRIPSSAILGNRAFLRCPSTENGLTCVNGILFDIDWLAHNKYLGNPINGNFDVHLPKSIYALSEDSFEWIGSILDKVVITDSIKYIHEDTFSLLGIRQFCLLNHESGKTIFKTTKFKSSYSAYRHLNDSESFIKMCESICDRDYEALAKFGTIYPENFPSKANTSNISDVNRQMYLQNDEFIAPDFEDIFD